MNKTKKLMKNIILASILLLLAFNLIFFNPNEKAANASESRINLNSDDFIYKETNYPIQKYAESLINKNNLLFNKNVTVEEKNLKVYGDDPIVNIIPKELFKKECYVVDIGSEYGYIIKTVKDYFYNFEEVKINYNEGNFRSYVMVFDITYGDENDENNIYTLPSYTLSNVKNLFQYEYMYLSNQNNRYPMYITKYKKIINNQYGMTVITENTISHEKGLSSSGNYELVNINEAVVPAPQCEDNYAKSVYYKEKNYFYIDDVIFKVGLENENHYNENLDREYYCEDDYGTIITGLETAYSGNELKNIDKEVQSLISNYVVENFVSLIDSTGILGLILSTYNFTEDMKNLLDGEVTKIENKFEYLCYGQTRRAQIDRYGGIAKIAHTNFQSETPDGKTYVIPMGGEFSTRFYLNFPRENTPWQTRITNYIRLKIKVNEKNITGDNKEVENISTKYIFEDQKYEEKYVEHMDIVENALQNLYILPNGINKIKFNVAANSDYTLTANKSNVNFTITLNGLEIKNNNGRFFLEEGKEYIINIFNIGSNTVSKLNINILMREQQLTNGAISNNTIKGNTHQVIKLVGSGFYKITSNNTNIIIGNAGTSSVFSSINLFNTDSFDINGDEIKYLCIYNKSNATINYNLVISECDSIGNSLGEFNLIGKSSNYYKIYKFNVTENARYKFNIINGANAFIKVYDGYGNNVSIISDGTNITGTVSTAQNYFYILLKSSATYKINVIYYDKAGAWFINNQNISSFPKENNILALKKDNSYSIKYTYSNNTTIYNINADIPSNSKYINNSLSLYYNANLYSEGTFSIKGFSDISFKFTIVHEGLKTSLSVDDIAKKAYVDVSNIYNLVSFRYEIDNNAEKKEYVENITTGKTRYDITNKIFINNNINVQVRFLNFIVRQNSNTVTISNANTNYNFINKTYVLYFAEGYGTKESPYLIYNERHLENTTLTIIKNLSKPKENKYIVFKLDNNISMQGVDWTPKDFYGELDGGGANLLIFQ